MEMPQLKTDDQPDYSGIEKRVASRLFLKAASSLVFEDSHEISAQITNISFSGAFVVFEYDDTESFLNQRVWLDFILMVKNKPHPLRVNGMIVRAVENGVGIQFRLSERNRIAPIIQNLTEGIEEEKRYSSGREN